MPFPWSRPNPKPDPAPKEGLWDLRKVDGEFWSRASAAAQEALELFVKRMGGK